MDAAPKTIDNLHSVHTNALCSSIWVNADGSCGAIDEDSVGDWKFNYFGAKIYRGEKKIYRGEKKIYCGEKKISRRSKFCALRLTTHCARKIEIRRKWWSWLNRRKPLYVKTLDLSDSSDKSCALPAFSTRGR